jgi:hypothetical protein
MPKTCGHCGAGNPETAHYCHHCGTPCAEGGIRSATRVSPVMAQWRRLNHSLTRKEVRKLLGEPFRVEATETAGAAFEAWIYVYDVAGQEARRVSGRVQFSVAEGRAVAWSEPEWGEAP